MALMQITIIPLGTASPSVGEYVADIERYLTQRGIEHVLGDMGTVVHGTTEELFTLARELHNIPFTRGMERVVTQITIDDRRDLERKLGEKQQAVYQRLQGRNSDEEKK